MPIALDAGPVSPESDSHVRGREGITVFAATRSTTGPVQTMKVFCSQGGHGVSADTTPVNSAIVVDLVDLRPIPTRSGHEPQGDTVVCE